MEISNRLQSNSWQKELGRFSFKDRLAFAEAVRQGIRKFKIENERMTLKDLFMFMIETNPVKWGFNKFASGSEGNIYKFGVDGTSIIIKDARRKEDAFFCEWLSKSAVETGACVFFPIFIDKLVYGDRILYAIEYADYIALYPEYLSRYLVTPLEFNQIIPMGHNRRDQLLPKTSFYDINAKDTLKMFFVQASYAFYVIQTINGHDFIHNDLHGRNTFVRRVDIDEPGRKLFFYSRKLKKMQVVTLPNIGAEIVIGDFGLSQYSGYYPSHPVVVFQKEEHDMVHNFKQWVQTFKRLGWNDLSNSLEKFFSTDVQLIEFDSLMESEFVRTLNLLVEDAPNYTIDKLYTISPSTLRYNGAHASNENFMASIFVNTRRELDKLVLDEYVPVNDTKETYVKRRVKSITLGMQNFMEGFVLRKKAMKTINNMTVLSWIEKKIIDNTATAELTWVQKNLSDFYLIDLKGATLKEIEDLFLNFTESFVLKRQLIFILKNAW